MSLSYCCCTPTYLPLSVAHYSNCCVFLNVKQSVVYFTKRELLENRIQSQILTQMMTLMVIKIVVTVIINTTTMITMIMATIIMDVQPIHKQAIAIITTTTNAIQKKKKIITTTATTTMNSSYIAHTVNSCSRFSYNLSASLVPSTSI